jgi:exopolysaccharide biosynthesis polyprenyl glycosylphosphotransferase
MSDRFKVLLLLIGDIASLYLSLFLTVFIWSGFKINTNHLSMHLAPFSFLFLGWILIYFIEGLYTIRSQAPAKMVAYIGRSTALNILLSFLAFYLIPISNLAPKKNLIIFGLLAFILITLWRRFLLRFFSWARFQQNILLVSNSKNLKKVKEILEFHHHLGLKVARHFNLSKVDGVKVDIKALKKEKVSLIVIDKKALKNEDTLNNIFNLLSHNIQVMDLSLFMEKISGEIPIDTIEQSWFLEYCGYNNSNFYRLSKAILDRSFAISLAIIIAPFYLPLLGLLLLISGRPLFFTQQRVGFFNKTFKLYKLRTMKVDAEKNGAQWATPNDNRVTSIGKLLRKTRLDEIPQLWNVIKGDMSLVGPRPERPEFTKELSKNIPFYSERHLVKPGVTGWAQINFRYGYSEDDSEKKLRFDLYYIKNKSIWMDIAIILKTIKTVLTGLGH